MASDVWKLVQQALGSTQGGRNQFYDPVADVALQIPEMIQQSNERKKLKNNDAFENLVNIAASANNPEGFNNVSASLSQLSKDSGGDTQLQTNIAVLEGINRTSRENYGIYKDGIDKGLAYVDSDAFPKELKDYENLDKIAFNADFKTEEGEGDIIAYLYAEKEKINSYRDKIGAGVEGGKKKFNYGKGMDSSVIRKLQEHDKRLNVAIQAYGEDGIITKAEAYHIMTGDLAAYKIDKIAAMGEAETMIKLGLKNTMAIDKLIVRADAKQLTAEDLSSLDVEYNINGAGLVTTEGGYEEITEKLKKIKSLESDAVDENEKKFKRWGGRNYDARAKIMSPGDEIYLDSLGEGEKKGVGGETPALAKEIQALKDEYGFTSKVSGGKTRFQKSGNWPLLTDEGKLAAVKWDLEKGTNTSIEEMNEQWAFLLDNYRKGTKKEGEKITYETWLIDNPGGTQADYEASLKEGEKKGIEDHIKAFTVDNYIKALESGDLGAAKEVKKQYKKEQELKFIKNLHNMMEKSNKDKAKVLKFLKQAVEQSKKQKNKELANFIKNFINKIDEN